MKELTLREVNGRIAQEADALVAVLYMSLSNLMESQPICFYELVMACRDHTHVLFGKSGEELLQRSLIESINPDKTANIHSSTRNIVLAATQGKDLQMALLPIGEITLDGYRHRQERLATANAEGK
jgi:hypothetical protein